MKQYLALLEKVMSEGTERRDRTGVGTKSLFGHQARFDLDQGFPLLTTKKVNVKAVIYELLWFLRGDTNIKFLVDHDVKIWNEWAFQVYLDENKQTSRYPMYSDAWKAKLEEFVQKIKTDAEFAEKWGELGPVYGKQWVKWQAPDGSEINQIKNAVEMIKHEPYSRRILVSGWNVGEIQRLIREKHAAPPSCHTVFQFYVSQGKLSCQLYQRSADLFLGVPFNIASYSLLTMMMAQVCNLEPGEFIHTFGDAHIYKNHFEQVKLQLSREPRPLPRMKPNPEVKDIFAFRFEDFKLDGYNPHPAIRAPIAV